MFEIAVAVPIVLILLLALELLFRWFDRLGAATPHRGTGGGEHRGSGGWVSQNSCGVKCGNIKYLQLYIFQQASLPSSCVGLNLYRCSPRNTHEREQGYPAD